MQTKKSQKTLIVVIIGVVVLIFLIAGIFMFIKLGKGGVDKVEAESEDGFAKLTATFYNDAGDAVQGGVTQALIGGINQRTGVIFELAASNTGNVGLTNVKSANPNANMNGAFDNTVPISTLAIGASSITLGTTGQSCPGGDTDCDTNEYCSSSAGTKCAIKLNDYASGTAQHNVDFSISLQGDYKDAQGNPQTVTSSPVTLTYDIRGETCSDATTINTCVFARTGIDSDKPDYCNFVEGSSPSIINKASTCGCPTGQQPSGENCVPITCTTQGETWNINTCATSAHENNYGAYLYCTSSNVWEPRCNQCGATLDANSKPKSACNPTTGEPSSAVYTVYTGGLSGCIPDCLTKTTGQSDGCGGTC